MSLDDLKVNYNYPNNNFSPIINKLKKQHNLYLKRNKQVRYKKNSKENLIKKLNKNSLLFVKKMRKKV